MAETDSTPNGVTADGSDGLPLGANLPVYSVSEISQAIKRTVEEHFAYVRVRGEISRLTVAASGHMYLTLKDEDAVLSGICWRGTAGRLTLKPEDGMEVIATGRLSTYPGRSNYQIIIEQMELAGEGALLKLLEDRRQKLLAEGLFDSEQKRALPYLPDVIGVVTSPTGAVIRDILQRLDDRFPRHVLMWPTRVQGDGAAAEVAAAIEGFNELTAGATIPRPDLLIVARGGGSLEDLWAFNEEVVVRAVAASGIPVISAVGHETDTTLIDFAADQRAPTPTAAAEMAVPVRSELIAAVSDLGLRALRATNQFLENQTTIVGGYARGLPEPIQIVEEAAQRLDDRSERLGQAIRYFQDGLTSEVAQLAAMLQPNALLERAKASDARLADLERRNRLSISQWLKDKTAELRHAAQLLESYSYERILERGFALVTDAGSHPVTSVNQASAGAEVSLRFHDGTAHAQIARAETDAGSVKRRAQSKPKPGRPAKPKSDDPQGSLL